MAGFAETACTIVGLFCVDPEPVANPAANGGDIDPDFYRRLEQEKAKTPDLKPATLEISPVVEFGQIERGRETRQSVKISNTGEQPLRIQALSIAGSKDFTLNGFCNEIAAGSSCSIETIFRPSLGGTAQGQLLVGVAGNIHQVQLTGTGMLPPPQPEKVVAKKAPPPPVKKAAKKVAKKKRVIKRAPVIQNFALTQAVQGMNQISSSGPSLFALQSFEPKDLSVLPSIQDRYQLKQLDYDGTAENEDVTKILSSLPVDRCRVVPKYNQIPLVLDSPINSQICGTVLAHVATDIFGPDGKLVLIPAMTPVEGTCEPLEETDATRIKVEFTEITRSDGAKITFKGGRGMDAMGQEGFVGERFERTLERRGTTVAYSGLAGLIAFITAGSTNDEGTTVDSPLSAAGEAINQNLAQIIAEEIRAAQAIKPRIRVRAGTLTHLKPPGVLYFQNPPRFLNGKKSAATANFTCNNLAYRDTTGTDQNP